MTLASDLQLPTSGRLPQLLHKALQFTLFTSCGNSDVMFALLHGPQNIALERNTLQNLRGAGLAHKTVHTEQVSDLCFGAGRAASHWQAWQDLAWHVEGMSCWFRTFLDV